MLRSKLDSLKIVNLGKGRYFLKGNDDKILKSFGFSKSLNKEMVLPSSIIAEGLLYEWKEGLNSNVPPTIASMVSRSIDLYYDKSLHSSIKEEIVNKFIATDSLCFVDGNNFGDTRISKIKNILLKIENALGIPKETLKLSTSFNTHSIEESNISKIISALPSHSLEGCYQMSSIEQVTLISKSILIPIAIWLDIISKEEAVTLIGMESDIQSERWGTLDDHQAVRNRLLRDINLCYLFLDFKE